MVIRKAKCMKQQNKYLFLMVWIKVLNMAGSESGSNTFDYGYMQTPTKET